MTEKKTKRATIAAADYYAAEGIGKAILAVSGVSGLSSRESKSQALVSGISKTVEHYLNTKDIDLELHEKLLKFKDIDTSITNNINAVYTLGRNEGFDDIIIKEKINAALKAVLVEIIGNS